MKTFLIRGIPPAIQQDSWWMDGPLRRKAPPREDGQNRRAGWERAGLLLALLVLADLLLWGALPGVALAIFGICLLGAGLFMTHGRGWGGFVLGTVTALPLIEQAQALSLLFFFVGMLTGGAWIALGSWPGLWSAIRGGLRLSVYGPLLSMLDLKGQMAQRGSGQPVSSQLSKVALGWTLPLGLGLVFLSLLVEANPVLRGWIEAMGSVQAPDLSRLVFWAGMAVLIWPFLRLSVLQQRLTVARREAFIGPRWRPAILNPDSVRRSLILFNALFAVQTLLDATFLLGGASMPEGMTYASYAHRGAYPLLLTALLAGGFALIARPFTDVDRAMRLALTLWIGQTILLVLSSILRLESYVEVYGLTRLRLSAGIWMAVVAAGLGITLWQITARQSTGWWLKRCAMLGIVTLYACMFVSFDRQIARYNLTQDVVQDGRYLCALDTAAQVEIQRIAPSLCDVHHATPLLFSSDWREWGLRDWRTTRALAAVQESDVEEQATFLTPGR